MPKLFKSGLPVLSNLLLVLRSLPIDGFGCPPQHVNLSLQRAGWLLTFYTVPFLLPTNYCGMVGG